MRKALLFTAFVIFSFALVGTAYATWTDALDIRGTVKTGTLEVRLIHVSSNDSGAQIDPGQTKHVASTEAVFAEKTALVTIENGYPGYTSQTIFEISNTGTVPVKVLVSIDPPDNGQNAVSLSLSETNFPLRPKESASFSIETVITEKASQKTKYIYTITVTATQWNR